MMPDPIYLDGFATLPLADEARDAMLAAWRLPGNGGSPNLSGERAAAIIDKGRRAVASLVDAAPSEIVFTSGATEANNIALLGGSGAGARLMPGRDRVIVSAVEHKSVLEPAHILATRGFRLSIVKVDRRGVVDLDHLAELLGPDVLMVSIMAANNETGVVQPVAGAAALSRAAGALIHCDAAQAAGKIPIDVMAMDVDYLSLSAHKLYGPMGIGALYIAAGAPVPLPLVFGGGQQRGVRPGTEPVPLIAGFGAAADSARSTLSQNNDCNILIEQLLNTLSSRQLRLRRVTEDAPVLPGSAALMIDGVDGDGLCTAVATSVSMSTGSACTSGQLSPSHVLDSMGLSIEEARSVVRLYCGRHLKSADVENAAEQIVDAAARSQLAAGELRQ